MPVVEAVIILIPNQCVSSFFQTSPLPSLLLCEVACVGNSITLILCLEKMRDSCTLFCFPMWYLTPCNRVYTSEPKGARTPTSQRRHCEITAFQAEAAQSEGSKEAEQDPASSPGEAQCQGEGENIKEGECYFFPSQTEDLISECKYNLKMHRGLKKPICYGLQWAEIAISSTESIFSFTKVSIDSGEDRQFSHTLLHRETNIHHFAGR